ncbi:MAG: DUF6462 family protein [Dorea sp.]
MKKMTNTPTVSVVTANKNMSLERNDTNDIDIKSVSFSDPDKICIFYPVKLADVEQACARYGIGRNTMREIAEQAHAIVRVKRLWKVNLPVMDAYFDKITE